MTKPNLFDFATSELSQDAFIAWLLAWADPRYAQADVSLHGTAVRLLERLLDLCSIPRPDAISMVQVKRQYKKIDVVVIVNKRIALGIEDKVHTQEHSGQLQRYRGVLSDEFGEENVAAVYLKTGDQCDYSDVDEAKFNCFGREDFIRSLKAGRDELGVRNHIYDDFLDHLERWEESVNAFLTIKLQDWEAPQWIGFYKAIRTELADGEWDYVPNQTGGFMGFWWHWKGDKYLQLEQECLCFKIRVDDPDKSDRPNRRNEWASVLHTKAAGGSLSIRKPDRRGVGKHMTVAVYDGDYRGSDSSGVLNMNRTLELLKRAENLLDAGQQEVMGDVIG